jgi:hypothetical protein
MGQACRGVAHDLLRPDRSDVRTLVAVEMKGWNGSLLGPLRQGRPEGSETPPTCLLGQQSRRFSPVGSLNG